MANGCPVIANNVTSIPEVAGNAAILVNAEDTSALAQSMLQLARDEARRKQLIAAGYEQAKKFTWAKSAAITIEAWERHVPDAARQLAQKKL